MSIFISPGVYSTEKDISNIIPNISTTVAGIVGYSVKGSTSQIKLITNNQQFIAEYGKPVPGDYFHYSALAFLANGNSLYCLRAANGALFGGVKIKTSSSGQSNVAIPAGAATNDFVAISGEDNLFYIFGKDPGVWNNDVGVRVTNIDTVNYTFDIEVWSTDLAGNPTKVESWTVSRQQQVDGYGRQQYLEDKINGFSDYISVADSSLTSTILPKVQATTLMLGEGDDGSAISDSNLVDGWDKFSNPNTIDLRLLINSGYTSITVQSKMKSLAESRKDCLAILDIPLNQLSSVSAQVTWRQSTQNFNSSYTALYSPWVKIYDSFNDKILIVPPSGHVAAQMAYNDTVAEPWFAPAGLNRGILNVLGLTNVYTQGERDTLYAAGINPLQTFRGQGNVIWGQKTQQVKASALDRVNVRRLLIILEKSISVSLNSFVFEPNNDITRLRVFGVMENFLDNLSSRGAFQSEAGDKGYQVVCDTTNNTPAIVDSNQLVVDVFVKPVRSAEIIQLRTIITTSGVAFNELINRGELLS